MPSASSSVPTPAISAAFGEMPRPLLLRRRGRGLRGPLHRVHQDDRVHEGKARVAAPLAALEAVALVGRQRAPQEAHWSPLWTGTVGSQAHRSGGSLAAERSRAARLGRDVGRIR